MCASNPSCPRSGTPPETTSAKHPVPIPDSDTRRTKCRCVPQQHPVTSYTGAEVCELNHQLLTTSGLSNYFSQFILLWQLADDSIANCCYYVNTTILNSSGRGTSANCACRTPRGASLHFRRIRGWERRSDGLRVSRRGCRFTHFKYFRIAIGKGDLLNFTSLGESWASGMVAEWEFRRQAGGMDDDKKEPKHEHDKS